MAELRDAGKLAKGAKGNPKGRGAKIVRVASGPAQTLADQGINKHLDDRARKAAGLARASSNDRRDLTQGQRATVAALAERSNLYQRGEPAERD